MKLALIALLLAPLAHAGIYGEDSRYESQTEATNEMRDLARSVPALIDQSKLKILASGDYEAMGTVLTKMNFCPEARFSDQKYLANCTASLIGPDLLLTAAHCIPTDPLQGCQKYKIVFDYAEGNDLSVIKKENVFECEKVEYRVYSASEYGEDLAILRLKTKVSGRNLIKLNFASTSVGQSLTMIGYPLGIPQKTVGDGKVLAVKANKHSFPHSLDTFSCNSGGPVFSEDNTQIGVLVRATSPNYDTPAGGKCYDWGHARPADYAEANSLGHLKAELERLGIRY